jgi:flagellar hook-associated protein 1 FlgK
VNLDEEAAKLVQYQQAYQASAQLIQVAQTIFDTLLQSV